MIIGDVDFSLSRYEKLCKAIKASRYDNMTIREYLEKYPGHHGVLLMRHDVDRDVRYALPFCLQVWMFATPVIYPGSGVIAWLDRHDLPAWLYGLNPMVGVVEGFRWALLGGSVPVGPLIASGSAVSGLLLLSGAYYFRRMERTFADVV